MTRRDALRALLEQVEAGWPPDIDTPYMRPFSAAFSESWIAKLAWDAHQGSLDAAKALHEAVLPGWWYSVHSHGLAFLVSPDCQITPSSHDREPARAWLICIIRALIEEAGK